MSVARQRLAGLGLLIGIVLVVVLGVTKPNPFANRATYWAEFDTASGMGAIDRDVRIAGVKVGDVGAIERNGDDVRVELRLDEGHVIKTDARADMRPHTLFEGSNFIDLSPGSPGAPELEQGGTVARSRTTNYVTLDRALRVLRPEIRENLRQLAKTGALTLQGSAIDGIQTTLRKSPALVKSLGPAMRAAQGPDRRELVGAVRGLSQTVDALASERDELVPLARRVNGTMRALAVDAGEPLDAALTELPGTLQALNESAPAVDAVIGSLTTFASRLGTNGPRALSRALRATTPVLTRARPVLRDGTPVIRDARLVGGRLAAAKDGLTKMFTLLVRPLELFPETFAALNKTTVLGASSGALQLVAGGFEGLAGAVATYRTPAQSPDQPGHHLRANIHIDQGAAAGLANVLDILPGVRTRPRVASCELVARVSKAAVAPVRSTGGCR